MPITLTKLLSPTIASSFEFMDETVNVTFAPMRYTGAMQELAERLSDEENREKAEIAELRAEADDLTASGGDEAKAAQLRADAEGRERRLDLRDRKALRDALASDGDGKGGPAGLLVSWDVMDGRKPLGTDRLTLDRLPDIFLQLVLFNLARENQPDPPKAPNSDEP